MNLRETIFRVVDMESTGLEPEGNGVCEVAYADINFHGRVLRANAWLLNPGMPIPPGSSAIHHIVDADVVGCPHLDAIRALLVAPVYVAHSYETDQGFLKLPGIWLCTHRLAKHLYPDVRNHSNQELRYSLGLTVDLPKGTAYHRARADVAVTAPLFARILVDAAAKWPDITTVDQLARKMTEPAILKWLPFKKDRDTEFADAETSHLEWIVDRGAGGPDCVHTALHHLRERGNIPEAYEFDEAES